MSLGVAGIVASVESHAETLGLFEHVVTNEPKNPPGKGLSVAIWADQMGAVAATSGLSVTSVRLVLKVRVLKPMLALPYGQIDTDILGAVDALMAAYSGTFTLEGQVREIDLLGQNGISLSAVAGYVTIEKQMFRIMDITLPMIINDLWVQVP